MKRSRSRTGPAPFDIRYRGLSLTRESCVAQRQKPLAHASSVVSGIGQKYWGSVQGTLGQSLDWQP